MDDDDSWLAEKCHEWGAEENDIKVGKWGLSGVTERLYNHAAFIWSHYHWMILTDRWECDDFHGNVTIDDFLENLCSLEAEKLISFSMRSPDRPFKSNS